MRAAWPGLWGLVLNPPHPLALARRRGGAEEAAEGGPRSEPLSPELAMAEGCGRPLSARPSDRCAGAAGASARLLDGALRQGIQTKRRPLTATPSDKSPQKALERLRPDCVEGAGRPLSANPNRRTPLISSPARGASNGLRRYDVTSGHGARRGGDAQPGNGGGGGGNGGGGGGAACDGYGGADNGYGGADNGGAGYCDTGGGGWSTASSGSQSGCESDASSSSEEPLVPSPRAFVRPSRVEGKGRPATATPGDKRRLQQRQNECPF